MCVMLKFAHNYNNFYQQRERGEIENKLWWFGRVNWPGGTASQGGSWPRVCRSGPEAWDDGPSRKARVVVSAPGTPWPRARTGAAPACGPPRSGCASRTWPWPSGPRPRPALTSCWQIGGRRWRGRSEELSGRRRRWSACREQRLEISRDII